MRPTYYLPLRPSLPLPAGTPIMILPHGVPAYYLTTYCGPASALTAQFEDALLGLGAGNWRSAFSGCQSGHTKDQSERTSARQDIPPYIVAWLAVQNKQGEDKGMPIVWPASLCISYHAGSPSAHARTPLSYIPELPAQLQSSPPAPASAVPTAISFAAAAASSAVSVVDIPASASTPPSLPPLLNAERERLSPSFQRRTSALRSSPTSDSLRALRTLTIARKPYARQMKTVASEVSGYVESVVKERERERERLRRERQEQELANQRAKLANTQSQPVAEAPSPATTTQEPPQPAPAELVPQVVPESSSAVASVPEEAAEPESQATVESDHSADSLFSPPDATIDLPSTEEEAPAAAEPTPLTTSALPADDQPAADVRVKSEAEPSSMPFDPFSEFDNTWGQQSSGYMDATMEYGMDFNMNMDSLGGGRNGGAGGGSYDVDDGFGVFTEDDFDFFDAPSAQRGSGPVAHVMAVDSGSGLTPAAGPPPLGLPPLATGDGALSGPGPPSATMNHSPPWTAQLGDPFTPRIAGEIQGMSEHCLLPDLLPPSPTKTPSSHSAPATPGVQLADSHKSQYGRKSSIPSLGPSVFDPIPFAPSHRQMDGKYAIGKFAFPSPLADMDLAEPVAFNHRRFPAFTGWRYRYNAVTDPRIGVVKKLIGVKRKVTEQGVREQRRSSAWDYYRESEEWQSSSPPSATVDSEESEDEPCIEDEETTASVPRPSTPPPSYLPLGPTLLQTHFHHSYLLPLCTPLKPPGTAASSPPGTAPPISVPTPVSPAAVLGAASEKSKSLEAAAQILVEEVVENPTWSEAWRANAALSLNPPLPPAKIWQADAKYIGHLLGADQDVKSPTTVQELFSGPLCEKSSPPSLRTMSPPMLAVGKDEAIVQLSPTSLRFWEKLGLVPRAGPKDVTAFVFYEGTDEERESEIESWLSRVSAAYSAKNFGSHVPGISSHSTKPGLVSTRFDTLRKTLMSFVSTIPTYHPHLVFYILTPSRIISPSSTVLRQILSAVRRFYKANPGGNILVHFVPESLIEGIHTHPASNLGGLDDFVCSVYDRILIPVTRAMSRKFFAHGAPLIGYFQSPAYALICTPVNKGSSGSAAAQVSFALESTVSSLDVMNRHMLLHVGYQVSSCGRWILAVCVDAEGEAHELKTWLTPDEGVEAFLVSQVWGLVHEFARRANIEWRIVVSKLGVMAHSEIDAWISHLDSAVSMSSEVPPMHVTLLAVDTENSLTFIAPPGPGSLDIIRRSAASQSSPKSSARISHATFSDVSFATYSLMTAPTPTLYPAYVSDRSAKCIPATPIPGSSDLPYVPDPDDDADTSNTSQQSPPADALRVPGWSIVICSPSSGDHTSVSTMRIFELHVTRSLRSTYEISSKKNAVVDPAEVHAEHMDDIIRNFHDLSVLARARWKLRTHPALPFHLAALELMHAALSGGNADP
ncbi:mediator complex subunit 13 C-terminal-domain-containing protein [Trametes punicea]|nr:mediator complex subunit 13 C-terminal-domain-containing protein [Trametes punicea]